MATQETSTRVTEMGVQDWVTTRALLADLVAEVYRYAPNRSQPALERLLEAAGVAHEHLYRTVEGQR
jgi:hypothetical protein